MTEGRAGGRLRLLAALVVVMFAALSTRLWFLQVLAAEQARDAAESNAVRLVEQGLVARKLADDDRRRLSLGLTARGRALVRRAPETGTSRLLRAASKLSDREVHSLALGLGKLANGLREEED